MYSRFLLLFVFVCACVCLIAMTGRGPGRPVWLSDCSAGVVVLRVVAWQFVRRRRHRQFSQILVVTCHWSLHEPLPIVVCCRCVIFLTYVHMLLMDSHELRAPWPSAHSSAATCILFVASLERRARTHTTNSTVLRICLLILSFGSIRAGNRFVQYDSRISIFTTQLSIVSRCRAHAKMRARDFGRCFVMVTQHYTQFTAATISRWISTEMACNGCMSVFNTNIISFNEIME